MYESPINLVVQGIETQMVQKEEQMILEAIRKCDVVVDKDELIKAINYDRNQYSKGYKDGVNDVLDKIMAEIDQKQYDFMDDKDYDEGIRFGLMLAYQIIDKYKTESDKESEE